MIVVANTKENIKMEKDPKKKLKLKEELIEQKKYSNEVNAYDASRKQNEEIERLLRKRLLQEERRQHRPKWKGIKKVEL